MKYVIEKRSRDKPAVWYMIAFSDTREWAKEIADALNICGNGEFRFTEQQNAKAVSNTNRDRGFVQNRRRAVL